MAPTGDGALDMAAYADQLTETAPGHWVGTGGDEVSYPHGGHHAAHELGDESFWYRHRAACILAAVRAMPPAGPLFDIGAGTGSIARHLAAHDVLTVAVEPQAAGAGIAWAQGVRPVVQASAATAGFRAASLPAIGLFDVVEHVVDDVAFLSSMAALLQPGGRLFVTVPAHQWLWSVDDVRAGHHRRYSRDSIRSAIETAGLHVDLVSAFFRPLPLPILLVRSLPSRLGLRRVDDVAAAARDHRAGSGRIAARLRDAVLAGEPEAIANGRPMRVGSSILVVATRMA